MLMQFQKTRYFNSVWTMIVLSCLSACSTWLPSAGPTVKQINESVNQQNQLQESDVQLISVDKQLIQDSLSASSTSSIPQQWKMSKPSLSIGKGDVVQISIFEAPPSVLLSSLAGGNSADMSIGGGAGSLNLPDQMVSEQGMLTVPFAGSISVVGKTTAEVEQIIKNRLSKIANKPQAVVRVTQNQANNVVVVADGKSSYLPLTAKGERLLDVLPLVGDNKRVKQTSVRLTRSGISRSLSLQSLSQHPENNVYLRSNDVVTVMQNPYRITVLGATNQNTVVDFGDDGLSVSEALGRVSGLNDYRADARGIYIFRPANESEKHKVFQLDMSNPDSMSLVQAFPLKDKDMLYVSNARSVHLQKILNLISMGLSPVSSVSGTVNSVDDVGR